MSIGSLFHSEGPAAPSVGNLFCCVVALLELSCQAVIYFGQAFKVFGIFYSFIAKSYQFGTLGAFNMSRIYSPSFLKQFQHQSRPSHSFLVYGGTL